MNKSSKRRRRQEVEKAARKLFEKEKPQPNPTPISQTETVEESWHERLLSIWWIAWIFHPAKFVWWPVGAFVIIISVIGSFPKVCVTVGNSFDEKAMLATAYNVINQGVFKIYDVKVHMEWKPDPNPMVPSNFEGFWYNDTNAMSFLAPGGSHSCQFYSTFPNVNPPEGDGALIQIDVDYKPVKFLKMRFTDSFRFHAQPVKDGRFVIIPYDNPDIIAFTDPTSMKRIRPTNQIPVPSHP